MDAKSHKFTLRAMDYEVNQPLFKLRNDNRTDLMEIFLGFFTKKLVTSITMSLHDSNARWNFLDAGSKKADNSMRNIYMCLACKIRIMGLQNAPSESKHNDRPLMTAVKEAKAHFDTMDEGNLQSCSRIEKILSKFLITEDFFQDLSDNFQNGLKELGDYVAGDEKLLKFFGNAADIQKCPAKPDKIGLWFYDLMIKLSSGKPFMIEFFLRKRKPDDEAITVTMDAIVRRWGDAIIKNGRPETILAFDSYYASNAVRTYLDENKHHFRFCASVTKGRFGPIFGAILNNMKEATTATKRVNIDKPGDFRSIYRPVSEESFTYVWDTDQGVDKKYCLSNCVQRSVRSGGDKSGDNEKLAYDTYKAAFNLADVFNRALHDRKWPHKHGGHGVAGQGGHEDMFAFSSIIQNVFNCYNDIKKVPAAEYEFKAYCMELSDQLFLWTAVAIEYESGLEN
ncbi:hypothetical protein B484DRAFT_431256 [Ochromonadaceae sp. CCMP2298]|nr:hypothetical protein B484DRAFT_431256 [Ochromonadaceae sp. CCMP2298]